MTSLKLKFNDKYKIIKLHEGKKLLWDEIIITLKNTFNFSEADKIKLSY